MSGTYVSNPTQSVFSLSRPRKESYGDIDHPHFSRSIPNARAPPPIPILPHPVRHRQQSQFQLQPSHVDARRVANGEDYYSIRSLEAVHRCNTRCYACVVAPHNCLYLQLSFCFLDGGR